VRSGVELVVVVVYLSFCDCDVTKRCWSTILKHMREDY